MARRKKQKKKWRLDQKNDHSGNVEDRLRRLKNRNK